MADGRQRVDKWLWFARLVKTRSLAARLVADGAVRVNRVRVEAPSHALKPGDVLTIALRSGVRVWRVAGFAERRGPAPAARLLYEDLSPRPPAEEAGEALAGPGD